MKSILIIALILLPFSLFSAPKCNEQMGAIEKEFMELTYMTKEELISDYCLAKRLSGILYSSASEFSESGSIDRSLEVLGEGSACTDYANKVFRVLRKDHGIESTELIQCPEVKEKISRANTQCEGHFRNELTEELEKKERKLSLIKEGMGDEEDYNNLQQDITFLRNKLNDMCQNKN